ncbi:hypothetical protein HQ585_12560 [candidate division KSB1 bacterium]|nr:hypothetical protein [candidate division KSB1 bacterium]
MINLTILNFKICPSTLYYLFSTIPQVIITLIAIIAVFIIYRINRLQDYLVGDGIAVFNRHEKEEKLFKERLINDNKREYKMTEIQYGRLRDGIERKNIYEKKEILKEFSDEEKQQGLDEIRHTGFHYLYTKRFCPTESQINQLKSHTKCASIFVILTVSFSLFSLAFIDIIKLFPYLSILSILINLFFSIFSLIYLIFILQKGLKDDATHELDRM